MGEKLKRERAEIINACKGTRTLEEVYDRIVRKKALSKSGWVVDVLTTLEAYLEIVLPQLKRMAFAKGLEIGPRSNVIDLSGPDYSDEFRALIIRSSLEWILKRESGVLTVIPESWRFIPQGRGNPVKEGCEQLIRQGAALNNWVAIDSQEVTSVDKHIVKSCGVWILGVQQEINEVKRVIDQLPGRPKPKPDDVMQLGLGQFYVAHTGAPTRKVYVQPIWMDASDARDIATGERSVTEMPLLRAVGLRSHVRTVTVQVAEAPRVPPARETVGSAMIFSETKEPRDGEGEDMASEVVERVDQLLRRVEHLVDRLDETTNTLSRPGAGSDAQMDAAVRGRVPSSREVTSNGQAIGAFDEEALFQRFRTRLLKDPAVLKVMATKPEIVVEHKIETITIRGDTLPGRIARLIASKFMDAPQRHADVKRELERTGPSVHNGNLSNTLKDLRAKGFLTYEGDSYQAVKEMKVRVLNASKD